MARRTPVDDEPIRSPVTVMQCVQVDRPSKNLIDSTLIRVGGAGPVQVARLVSATRVGELLREGAVYDVTILKDGCTASSWWFGESDDNPGRRSCDFCVAYVGLRLQLIVDGDGVSFVGEPCCEDTPAFAFDVRSSGALVLPLDGWPKGWVDESDGRLVYKYATRGDWPVELASRLKRS